MNSCAGILLAAGQASRMGRLKQMMPYGEGTMLSHCVEQARLAAFERLIIVVGAQAEEVQASLVGDADLEFVLNAEWQLGMGSSIVAGMTHLQTSGVQPTGVAILLGDQPLIRADHLLAMRRRFDAPDVEIVAAQYGGTLGVPAYFKAHLFPKLCALAPEEGARRLLRDSGEDVAAFDLPEAEVDVDTPEDFRRASVQSLGQTLTEFSF